jgi:hypothetical protein
MWLIYDEATGAEIRRVASIDTATGEAAAEIPASALLDLPISQWSANRRGFVDVPLVDGPRMGLMLTSAEIEALVNHADAAVRAIPLRWLLLIAFGMPQRVNSPLHISTANGMLAAGVLTQARHAQFLSGDTAPIA